MEYTLFIYLFIPAALEELYLSVLDLYIFDVPLSLSRGSRVEDEALRIAFESRMIDVFQDLQAVVLQSPVLQFRIVKVEKTHADEL